MPARKAAFEAALAETLAQVRTSRPPHAGCKRAAGGRDQPRQAPRRRREPRIKYIPGKKAGEYRPTPPDFTPAAFPQWGMIRPFVLTSASQFRPAPPLDPKSARARGDRGSALIGGKTSSARTAEQSEISRYWYELAAGLEPHRAWWPPTAASTMGKRAPDGARQLRDGRRFHRRLRSEVPLQVLAPGDRDPGNGERRLAARSLDAARARLSVDAHGARRRGGRGSGPLLRHRLRVVLDDERGALPGITRKFWSFSEAARENGASRILAGIHFATAVQAGYEQGERIGAFTYERALRRFLLTRRIDQDSCASLPTSRSARSWRSSQTCPTERRMQLR